MLTGFTERTSLNGEPVELLRSDAVRGPFVLFPLFFFSSFIFSKLFVFFFFSSFFFSQVRCAA